MCWNGQPVASWFKTTAVKCNQQNENDDDDSHDDGYCYDIVNGDDEQKYHYDRNKTLQISDIIVQFSLFLVKS